jgi:hypothetical protein
MRLTADEAMRLTADEPVQQLGWLVLSIVAVFFLYRAGDDPQLEPPVRGFLVVGLVMAAAVFVMLAFGLL